MRILAVVCLSILAALFGPSADAEDSAMFSPMLATTAKAGTPPAATSATHETTLTTIAPVTTPTPEPSPTTSFFFTMLMTPTVVMILGGLIIRLEVYLQTKTKFNVAKGAAVAHTIFNLLRDDGIIAHGNVSDAIDKFWIELERQSQQNLGTVPNALIEDSAHATFTRLLKEHLDATPLSQMAAMPAANRQPPPIPGPQPMIRSQS